MNRLTQAIWSIGGFIGVFSLHAGWHALLPSTVDAAQSRWVTVPTAAPPWHQTYLNGGDVWLGLSIASAGAFATWAIRRWWLRRTALMGVAGGELLIPTCVLLFGVDLKLAGSLAMAVSLPTMLMGFVRYSRDPTFAVIRRERRFLALLCLGSLIGVALGGLLLGAVPTDWLLGGLSFILAVSTLKTWMHAQPAARTS